MDLLRHVREHHPEIRVLMITGYGTIELAVEAMRRGAAHFITKPFDNRELLSEVERHGLAEVRVHRGDFPAVLKLCNAGVVASGSFKSGGR